MKKTVIDYRELRLSNICTPKFRHLFLLLGWVGYFLLYLLTENLIPQESCHVMDTSLDNFFPFCEYFVVPYVGWYLLIVVSLLYFLLYNVDSFKRLQTYIIITQVVAMTIYIIYPSCQNLRPEQFFADPQAFADKNVFTWLLSIIYTADTNTGVCPSLHVAYSLGIASVWLRERDVSICIRIATAIFCLVICFSTLFVKQHAALDFILAIPVCIFAELVVYRDKYFKKAKL